MFATLTPEQWRTPSLCAGWIVNMADAIGTRTEAVAAGVR